MYITAHQSIQVKLFDSHALIVKLNFRSDIHHIAWSGESEAVNDHPFIVTSK